MGTMEMTMSHGSARSTSSEAMSMSTVHGTINILPAWLAVIWTLLFIAILVTHVRHALASGGQRRFWHSGHVLMAAGMAFMFAPASINHFDVPTGFWQLAFANGSLAVLAWLLSWWAVRSAINVLWLVMALDQAAMVYMWSAGSLQAPITWLLVAYFLAQGVLWGSDRMRSVDHKTLWGSGASITPDGAVVMTAAEPLVCFRDLRASMLTMTVGMAYMLAAMQLVT
jgi:hypothetical protein